MNELVIALVAIIALAVVYERWKSRMARSKDLRRTLVFSSALMKPDRLSPAFSDWKR